MVLVQGGRGFCAGASHDLELSLRCQVICVLLFLSDSSHCESFPTGITKCKMQGCHGYPMRLLGLFLGLTLLSRHHSPSLSIVDDFNVQLRSREINYLAMHHLLYYSQTPLFRSPKGNGKKFKIAGFQNNWRSIKFVTLIHLFIKYSTL